MDQDLYPYLEQAYLHSPSLDCFFVVADMLVRLSAKMLITKNNTFTAIVTASAVIDDRFDDSIINDDDYDEVCAFQDTLFTILGGVTERKTLLAYLKQIANVANNSILEDCAVLVTLLNLHARADIVAASCYYLVSYSLNMQEIAGDLAFSCEECLPIISEIKRRTTLKKKNFEKLNLIKGLAVIEDWNFQNVPYVEEWVVTEDFKRKNEKYETLSELGSGALGVVYKVQNKQGRIFALKEQDPVHLAYMELNILAQYKHPNLIAMVNFDLPGEFRIILEYADMDLWKWVNKNPNFKTTDSLAQKLVLGMLRGLAYLHEMGIMHRDIKPDNLLVMGEDLKIADFGAATRYDTERLQDVAITTVPYRAPELLVYGNDRNKKAKYGPEVDIWAVGLVLLCLEFRYYPFRETEPIALLASLLEEFEIPHVGTWPLINHQLNLNYDKKGNILRKVENETKRKLIKSILCLDAQKRPTARKLLKTFSKLLL